MNDAGQTIEVSPSVLLVAETGLNDEEMYEGINNETSSFIDFESDGEILSEFAGRACYQSFHNPARRTNQQYIANIVDLEHFSVLEHASCTFYLQGVSRSFTHELVRHRHFSYSQLSQRYVDSTTSKFVCPPLLRNTQLHKAWIKSRESDLERLKFWEEDLTAEFPDLKRKQIREALRGEAPNCIETKIVVTGNLRAWREFLNKRWHAAADAEMQEVAGLLAAQLKKKYPFIFADISYTS